MTESSFHQWCQPGSLARTNGHFPASLLLLANGDQGQNTRNTVFPLNTGR